MSSVALRHLNLGGGADDRRQAWSLQSVNIDADIRLIGWMRAPNASFEFSDFYGPDTWFGCCYYILLEAILTRSPLHYVLVIDGNTTPGSRMPWEAEFMDLDEWVHHRFRMQSATGLRNAADLPPEGLRSWVQREQRLADPTRETHLMRHFVAAPLQSVEAVVHAISNFHSRPPFTPIDVQFPSTKDLYAGRRRDRYTRGVYNAIVENRGHTNHVRFNRSRGMFNEYAAVDMRLYYVVFMALIQWLKPLPTEERWKAIIVSAEDVIDGRPLYVFQHYPLPEPSTFFRWNVSLLHLRIHIPLTAPDVSLLLGCVGRSLHTLYLTVSGHPAYPYLWNLECILASFRALKQFRVDVVGDVFTAVDWLFQADNLDDGKRRYQSSMGIILPPSFQRTNNQSRIAVWQTVSCQVWIDRFEGSLCPDEINQLQRRAFGQQFRLRCTELPPADMHPGDDIPTTVYHLLPTHPG